MILLVPERDLLPLPSLALVPAPGPPPSGGLRRRAEVHRVNPTLQEVMVEGAGNPRYQSKFDHTKEPACCTSDKQESERGRREQWDRRRYRESFQAWEDPGGLAVVRGSAPCNGKKG